jgi:hypothetical protein
LPYFLRPLGFCVRADPEADFTDLLEPLLLKVLEAADAALGDVTFTGDLVCDNAEPAADFAVLLEFGFFNTFDAAEAAFLLVISLFFDMIFLLRMNPNFGANLNR